MTFRTGIVAPAGLLAMAIALAGVSAAEASAAEACTEFKVFTGTSGPAPAVQLTVDFARGQYRLPGAMGTIVSMCTKTDVYFEITDLVENDANNTGICHLTVGSDNSARGKCYNRVNQRELVGHLN
jgi:hypothetical protein